MQALVDARSLHTCDRFISIMILPRNCLNPLTPASALTTTGGPVYVQSSWGTPPAPEKGLVRLDQPLIGQRGRIAHVALVYSDSEPLEPRLGSVSDTVARALLAHRHYTSVLGALRLLSGDAWAMLHEKGATGPVHSDSSSLRPRDARPTQREDLEDILHRQTPPHPLLFAHPTGPPSFAFKRLELRAQKAPSPCSTSRGSWRQAAEITG